MKQNEINKHSMKARAFFAQEKSQVVYNPMVFISYVMKYNMSNKLLFIILF